MKDPPASRELRHVRGTRVHEVNAIYHLRTSTVGGLPLLAADACKRVVVENLKLSGRLFGLDIIAYVVMPEHVHAIVQPRGDHNISDFMASFKKHSARKVNKLLGRTGGVWRREFFDHMLRSREHLHELADYIHCNPVRRGLVACPEDWRFSSWHEVHEPNSRGHPPAQRVD